MKKTTKNKLYAVWQYCDDNDKSTEFMLEQMQAVANVDLDCVINFMMESNDLEKQQYFEYVSNTCKSTN